MPSFKAMSIGSHPPAAYAAAVLAVATALVAGRVSEIYLDTDPFVSLFLCAILFASWFGGAGPGLLATALASLAFDYFFVEPNRSFAVVATEIPRLALFLVVALFVVLLTSAQRRASEAARRARDELERAVVELERLNRALETENAERRRAEEEIRRTQRELQRTVDGIPVMAASYTSEGALDFVNQTWRDYTGVTLEDREHRWGTAIHPDDLPMVEQAWRSHLATGEPFQLEQRMRRRDGQYRWYVISRVPVRDETGRVVRWYGAGYDIEDQKRALAELQQSRADLAKAERELRQMVDTIPVLVRRFRADGTPDYANRTSCEFSGIPFERQSEDRQWFEVVHPDDREAVNAAWRAHLSSGTPFEIECRLRRADGEYRRVLARRVPLRDQDGKVVRWYGAASDIEDQKRAIEALQRSEAELALAQRELRQMIDTIPVLVRRFTADGTTDYVNRTTSAYTGRPPENWPTVPFQDHATHPEDLERVEREWRAHVRAGRSYETVYRLRRHDGQYRRIFACRVPLRDESGAVIRWYGAGYDVEEHLQSLEALQRSEAELAKAERELRLIVDTIPAMVTTYHADGTLDFVNQTWRKYTGYPPDVYTHARWKLIIHPNDFATVADAWAEHLAARTPFRTEQRVQRADGSYRWCQTSRVPLLDDSGEVVRWYGASYDIDDQKQALAALQRSQAYLDEAQRLSRTGWIGWRVADGEIIWSDAACDILGVDRSVRPTTELILGLVHPDDRELVARQIERARRGEDEYDYEHRLLAPDGSIRHIHVRAHRVMHEWAEEEIVGAVMDVTAAREAEAALQSAQAKLAHVTRVATLAEMSASIAHEVNQPLAAIAADGAASMRWLQRDAPDVGEAMQGLRRIVGEADRASRVIRRIRDLAKKSDTEMVPLDINSVVEEAVALVQREAARHRAAIRLELAPGLPRVRGDRIQLQQVIINLVLNGVQAMEDVTDRPRVLTIRSARAERGGVLLAVQDAGVGVAPENMARLFGAFYTTKPDGMGMGLSICRSIVEAHGGRVWASPNTGPGMTFQFTVTAAEEPVPA